MKKFSVIFVAVAFAMSLAVPAMAVHFGSLGTGPTPAVDEGFSISGSYTIDAEDFTDRDDTKTQWFDDDLEVVLKVNKGDVTAVVDLEVSDNESFDGSKASSPNLIDNYWVQLDNFITDGLGLKIGEYSISFAKKVVVYAEGAHVIGLKYGIDNFDLGLYIAKNDENKTDPETDEDMTILTANVKGVDFFKKLNFIFITDSDESPADTRSGDYGYTGIDAAFDLGPVPVTIEYGAISDDAGTGNDGGTFYVATANFKELVNFDLGLEYYSGNEDMGEITFGSNDYFPLMIYGFRSGDNGGFQDVNLAILTAGYKYSDDISLKAKVLVQGKEGSSMGDGDVGTEIDLHATVKLASNASATLTYATWAPGDAYAAPDDNTATDLRARLKLTF